MAGGTDPDDVRVYWPDEPRRVLEVARLELARVRVEGEASLKQVARRVTELAARTLRVERAGVWVFLDDRSALRCYDLFERSKNEHSEGAVLYARDFPTYFRAMEQRRDIPADLAVTDPLTQEFRENYLVPLGIVSLLDAPIYREGRVMGVVCHEQVGTPRRWSSEERDFAASVADICALKLETALRQEAEAALQLNQAYLVEHEKMEALGRLAARTAHDFRNLITVLLANADSILRHPAASPEIHAHARVIGDTAERGATLAKELLSYGSRAPQASRVIDVAGVIEGIAEILRSAVGARHRIRIQHAGSVGQALIDPTQLERVMLNLVLNARDAMPEGGEIQIDLDHARSEGYVALRVRDSGVGMDAETQAQMFEPFFSTKEGRGSGLGLAIVQQIVNRSGGYIRVDSAVGQGTSISVYLPRVAGEGRA